MADDTPISRNGGSSSNSVKASPSRPPRSGILEALNTMLSSPYYFLNIMLVASYAVIREHYRHAPIRQGMPFLGEISDFQSWERYVAFLCGCSAAFRFIKARSRLAGLASLLNFAQLFIAIMATVCSPILLAYLVIAYGLIYLLFPQPIYPLHEILEPLTPEALDEDVKQAGTDVMWVVYCYAPWHPACRHMSSDVADVAARYGTDRLKFGMLDVSEYTKTAGKLGIELSPVSQALPTIILYEKGEEVIRIPQKKGNGALYGANFKAKDVVRSMELDMRYTRSMQKAREKKGQ